jgi:hypothetical protein
MAPTDMVFAPDLGQVWINIPREAPEFGKVEEWNRAKSLGLDLQHTMLPPGWKKGRKRSTTMPTFRRRRQ